MTAKPLTSVVTPVYNGARYLPECIESVLSQTYSRWEYIIVNNLSTDETLEIALHYAERDSRIRVITNNEFLSSLQNHNAALHQISPDSKYCKIVHADDWIFPECLEKMVKVAEENPSVGLVGAYALEGTKIRYDGLPYPSTVVPGWQMCRSRLLGGPYVFGTPTTLLIRSEIIKGSGEYYGDYLHADLEACYRVLQDHDFGFVHQVLTFSRVHPEQQSSIARKYNYYLPAAIDVLKKFGPVYLTDAEYETVFKNKINKYYIYLAKSLLAGMGRDFWNYHRNEFKRMGLKFNPARFPRALAIAAAILIARFFRDKLQP